MHRIPEQHTQHPRAQTHQGKSQGVGARHGGLWDPQHPQHGTVVQVAGGVHPGGDGHRDRAQQRGQQGHQVQEFFCPGQGFLHLRPPALQRVQAHAAALLAFQGTVQPGHVTGHLGV